MGRQSTVLKLAKSNQADNNQSSQPRSRKKKSNTSNASKKKSLKKQPETVEVTEANSSVATQYFLGTFFSLTVALSIVAVMMASSFETEFYNLSTSSRFGGVFVHAGDLTSSYSGIGYHGSTSGPSLCSDGYTYGYTDWNTLRIAIHEANTYAETLASMDDSEWIIDDFGIAMPSEPLPTPEPFVICPGTTLKGNNRRGPIVIDSEDLIIECDSCTVDVSGTHFAFGQNAKGITIRGVTFMNARTSSLTFYHHGADVSFEDCRWEKNAGIGQAGAVADLNSTSSVSFFRCEISDSMQMPRANGFGTFGGSSSLTIRD